MSFKTYSSKRAAEKGAERAGYDKAVVQQRDGQWGFDNPQVFPEPTETCEQGATSTELPGDGYVADAVENDSVPMTQQLHDLLEMREDDARKFPEESDTPQNAAPQPEASQISDAALPVAAPPATTRKVQKDRPMQNGVKMPSEGGKCRAVWDKCFELAGAGVTPTPELLKAWAAETGANVANAVIELYAWRKFNGITGRVK